MRIWCQFSLEAAHWLPNVPDGHKCKRMHGHNYTLRVHVTAPIDDRMGWAIDYADVVAAVQPHVDALDHRLLNDIDGLSNPTAEHIAIWFHDRVSGHLPGKVAVEVFETPTTCVIYEP